MNLSALSKPSVPGQILNARRLKQTIAFASLLGFFPRNITPTDVDFCVEISSCFLIGEFKHVGNAVPKGQRMALERMVKKLGRGTVAFVAEHDTAPDELVDAGAATVVEFLSVRTGAWEQWDCTVEEFCRQWVKQLPEIS